MVGSMRVVVKVTPEFRPEASRTGLYVFSYLICIENHHLEAFQLLSRHWWIEDAHNEVMEVEGEGVVGLQPTIPAGGSFEYSSWVQVRHVPARMHGQYHCVWSNGTAFVVDIPVFTLRIPGQLLN